MLVDFDHEKGCRQDGRGHSPHRPRKRNVLEGIMGEILPRIGEVAVVIIVIVLVIEEPPRRIVRGKVDALDHSDREQRPRHTGIQGTSGPHHFRNRVGEKESHSSQSAGRFLGHRHRHR